MKLTKSVKRAWAYVLVAALVVSSMVGYQAQTVSADVDYSTLTYEAIDSLNAGGSVSWANGSNNTSVDFSYALLVEESTGAIVDWMTTGNGGFQLYNDQFLSITWHGDYSGATATVNGVDVVEGGNGVNLINNVQTNLQTSVLFDNNTYNVVKITSADESQYVTFVVKVGTPASGSEVATTPAETTTEAPTPEPETDADGFIPLVTETWEVMGAWTTYFGVSWANATGAYKGGATLNDFTLRVDSNNYSGYGIQAKATGLETVAGTTYKSTIKFVSNNGGFGIATKIDGITDEVGYDVVVGDNVIETTFTATGASTDIFFNLTGMAAGTTFTFTEVSVAEADKTPEMIEKERVEALFTSAENIALNKTATASSAAAVDAYLARESFDGNIKSRWAAGSFESGEWIAVDLGAMYDITSVALAWEGAFATEYIIQVSEDGETYTDALTVTATQAETVEKEVSATGQFVRIYCVSNGLPYPYSIWEIAVLGTPVGGEEPTTEEVTTEEVTTEEVTTEEATTEEATTEEVTTEEATTEEATTEEVTTEEATEDTREFIPLTTETWEVMGAWTTYFGVSWANATGAYKGGETLNDFVLRVDSNNYSGYGIQAKATGLETAAGTTYKATIKFNSNVGGFSIATKVDGITDEVSYAVVEGANVIETVFVATADSTDIFFNLTGMPAGAIFTFSEVSAAEAEKTPEMIEKERVEAIFASAENKALNKTVLASTAGEGEYVAANAMDGNLDTRWAALSYEAGEWIAVDLGKSYNITSVALAWEGAYASEYIIQVSEDGETYTDVMTVTATQAETLEKTFTATGRYVRVYCVSNGLPYPYSIWEMAVLGTPVDGEEPTTEAPTDAPEDPTDAPETTTVAPETETTTKAPETTTVAPTTQAPTTVAPTTKAPEVKKPAQVKIKKVYAKKKASKTVKIKIKKVSGAKGYQVQISKSKSFKKKNLLVNKKTFKKLTASFKSKKIKNKKKVYVRVRAYKLDANGKKVYGKWSKSKKVKVK